MSDCTVLCCEGLARARGLCNAHYQQAFPSYAGQPCTVDGCDRPGKSRLYCSMHTERLRRTGSVGMSSPLIAARNQACSVDGCSEVAKAQGFCTRHYQRQRAVGDPGPAERIRRQKGSGSVQQGYLYTAKRAQHRAVWEAVHGPIPKGYVVHHKNHDKLDNRLENLEVMTRAQHRAHHHGDLLAGKQPKETS